MTSNKVLELLAELVRKNTVNEPAKGKLVGKQEAEEISSILEKYGFKHEVNWRAPVPIIYSIRGTGRPVTLWLAHYDTVPPGPGWTLDPFDLTIKDDKAYGRGATDDKGNVAALASAFSDYTPQRGTMIVAFTGDEEIGGKSAEYLAQWLWDNDLFPDYLINADGGLSKIIIRRRGGFLAEIKVREDKETVKGKIQEKEFETRILLRETMHSAYFIPGVDAHAAVMASLWARDSDILISEFTGEWVKTNVIPHKTLIKYYTPGDEEIMVDYGLTELIKAIVPLVRAPIPTDLYSDYGVSINPNYYVYENGHHILKLDIRAMTINKDSIREVLDHVLENSLQSKYELTVKGGKGYLYTDPKSSLVKWAQEVSRKLGLPDKPVEAGGASDSRYYSPRGVESIDYGPLGGNIHGPNEYVSIIHLYKTVEFYKELARLIHG